MIRINNLSFGYSDTPILAGLTLEINQGDTVAIIGCNGSGKSTLIQCLAGLLPVKSGSISILDKELRAWNRKDLARTVAYVPQLHGRALPFTVYDFVMLGRYPYQGLLAHATADDKTAVEHALLLTDSARFADRAMNTLSGGELQRVLIASAVAQQASVLLLDEPATFLDPPHQEAVQRLLEDIHRQFNATIITVTHDINTALNRYSKILALKSAGHYIYESCGAFFNSAQQKLAEVFGIEFEEAITKSGWRLNVPQIIVDHKQ